MLGYKERKEYLEKILEDTNIETINVSLNDLVWSMIYYNMCLIEHEKELQSMNYQANILDKPALDKFRSSSTSRECMASRIDELGRIISSYSDFDTQKIYTILNEIKRKEGV